MGELVLDHLPQCDVLIMTAAVGDFAPESVQKEKIKKRGEGSLILYPPSHPGYFERGGGKIKRIS